MFVAQLHRLKRKTGPVNSRVRRNLNCLGFAADITRSTVNGVKIRTVARQFPRNDVRLATPHFRGAYAVWLES